MFEWQLQGSPCAAALLCASTCVALACAHPERPQQPRSAHSLETRQAGHRDAHSPTASASDSLCGSPTGHQRMVAFRWPVNGGVTSSFGGRRRNWHRGIDIGARYGTVVRAAAAGRVVFSGRKRDYGRMVILEHADGYTTVYAHNQENFALNGAYVQQGEEIAEVGSTGNATGPHLHFEVRIGDRLVDPLACLPIRAAR